MVSSPVSTSRSSAMKRPTLMAILVVVTCLIVCSKTCGASVDGNDAVKGDADCRQCSVTKCTLPPHKQHPDLVYGGEPSARVLFLLGYPHTGTTATHFLLATSRNVSTLRNPDKFTPGKEGWSIVNLKNTHEDEWDGDLEYVDWGKLAQQYGEHWDPSKPVLVENSPPEIQKPEELVKHFEPIYGKVKFLMLVRGDCTNHNNHRYPYQFRSKGHQHVLDMFPRDTFVLRFEDLCLRWDEVYLDLVRWEPLLHDMDIMAIPGTIETSVGQRKLHSHSKMSVLQYCESKLSEWKDGLSLRDHGSDFEAFATWGYENTTKCQNDCM